MRNKYKRNLTIAGIILAIGLVIALVYILILYSMGAISIGGKSKPPNTISSTTSEELPPQTPEKSDTYNGDDETFSSSDNNSDDVNNSSPTPTEHKQSKGIIVLDPGHGKSSSAMSESEKTRDGWLYNSQKGGWGEWRHWKSGTTWQDCLGSGCSGRAPQNGGCWYPIGAGDRDKEPQINLNNTLAARRYLEQMGYEVRMTREDNNTNPSMTKRLKYCYPDNDTTRPPDADAFICIHSNAGGGRGSYYIALSDTYDQAGIPTDYITAGNTLGADINKRIVSETNLSAAGSNGRYDGYPTLVLFCKSPITIAYMEIGFFDNASDLAILNNSADAIGKAVAEGINDYMSSR